VEKEDVLILITRKIFCLILHTPTKCQALPSSSLSQSDSIMKWFFGLSSPILFGKKGSSCFLQFCPISSEAGPDLDHLAFRRIRYRYVVMLRLLQCRTHFFFRSRQIINNLKCSPKAILHYCSFFFLFWSHRSFSKCHFPSLTSYFFKHCRRLRGMKLSAIGEVT
jgi:hypothetical protein